MLSRGRAHVTAAASDEGVCAEGHRVGEWASAARQGPGSRAERGQPSAGGVEPGRAVERRGVQDAAAAGLQEYQGRHRHGAQGGRLGRPEQVSAYMPRPARGGLE